MSQNKGTLITAPIRPNDTMDPIASAFSNELKGGHHSYATLAERDGIILARRDWGMLCTVYDDGVNNGVYKLEYNFFSTSLADNANWILFSSGGSSDGEWLSSVLSVQSSPPTSNDGDRYLVFKTKDLTSKRDTGAKECNLQVGYKWLGKGCSQSSTIYYCYFK